jgi:hypothetical protein
VGWIHRESAADQEIATWLTGHEYPTEPRHVRTWREWKLLDPAVNRSLGFRLGSRGTNAPQDYERALVLATVSKGRKLNQLRLTRALFGRSEPVTEGLLRTALKDGFDDMLRIIDKHSAGESAIDDKSDAVAEKAVTKGARRPTIRFMRRRGRGKGDERSADAIAALSLLYSAIQGGELTWYVEGDDPAPLDSLIDVSGLRGMVEDTYEGSSPLMEGDRDAARDITRTYLTNIGPAQRDPVIEDASLEELEMSRDDGATIFTFLGSIGYNAPWIGYAENAFGLAFGELLQCEDVDELIALVSVLFLAVLDGPMRKAMHDSLERQQPFIRLHVAVRELLTTLPIELRGLLAPGALSGATPDERERLGTLMDEFERDRPDQYASIRAYRQALEAEANSADSVESG